MALSPAQVDAMVADAHEALATGPTSDTLRRAADAVIRLANIWHTRREAEAYGVPEAVPAEDAHEGAQLAKYAQRVLNHGPVSMTVRRPCEHALRLAEELRRE